MVVRSRTTQTDWNKNIWKQVAGAYDPASVLYDIGKRVVEIYAQAFESGGKPLPSAPAFGHLLARLVQLTD